MEARDLIQKAKWSLCVWFWSNKEFSEFKALDLFQCCEGGLMSSPRIRKNLLRVVPTSIANVEV